MTLIDKVNLACVLDVVHKVLTASPVKVHLQQTEYLVFRQRNKRVVDIYGREDDFKKESSQH